MKRGSIRWTMVGLIMLVAAVSYLDRSNISIAARYISADLALTERQLGLVFSAFAVGYALAQPFAGRLADRFGATRMIAVAIASWSLLTSLTATVTPILFSALTLLLMVRLSLGVCESAIFPASNRLVANWIPPQERGLANGLIFAAVGIGGGMAPPLISAAIRVDGWRWGFWICAIIGLAVLAIWLLIARERPEKHRWVGAAELAHISRSKQERQIGDSGVIADWSTILQNRTVLLLTLSYFCFGYVAFMFSTWFFTYISNVRGLDLKASGFYATLPFIGIAIGSPFGGVLADRLARTKGEWTARCLPSAVGMCIAGGFLAMAPYAADARVAAVVLACGSASMYVAQSSFWTLSANIGQTSAGTVSGVMNMGCQFGAVAVSFATPFIKDAWGWSAPFVVTGLLSFVGGAAWLLVNPASSLRSNSDCPDVPTSSRAEMLAGSTDPC